MLHIFPRVNSTLDLDLVQFINSLHALFQNVTNLTRQQHVAIRYLETCKRRLVENLIIQDHHCSKMVNKTN
jgi:hypothetical protein